ncbi:ATP-dependent RNA helicase dbp10 [Ascosphaera atra]|nr:ATP-dependent RNA helicase dbp10 [Ascosphaera atra]
MGLSSSSLKAIAKKGFAVPTPIQRKVIPAVLDGQDVVAMARTGSGKTAAFVIPMVERLKNHSPKVGSRALILSPSRELALQTLKVVKDLGRGTDLSSVLLVGGDSMENQFGYMTRNPDVIIATPGRFLHLKVEMNLDLSSIRYVVFDEADRLFEMGFAAQLSEILHGLPSSRQTLLFSATLPRTLVEFARAGLQDPSLIRLDAENKVSPNLQNAFFTVKSAEKEGALLHVLHDVINVPTGETEASKMMREKARKIKEEDHRKPKRKRHVVNGIKIHGAPTEHSTIVFVATKHHAEYITSLLREAGFAVSYAYGSLNQAARKIEAQKFRTGVTHIFVVTDVAARGIDIPILANVINYDFPTQPKIFIHRVGRTARAGQRGWSYSLVRDSDAPYLLDLLLFLGRPLVLGRGQCLPPPNYTEEIVVGSLVRDAVSWYAEWVDKLTAESVDIEAQRGVAAKGEKLYNKTRNAASDESAKRAKLFVQSDGWMMLHPLFSDETSSMEAERGKMLAKITGFRPQETVFETKSKRNGKKECEETIGTLQKIRSRLDKQKEKKKAAIGVWGRQDVSGNTGYGDISREKVAHHNDDDVHGGQSVSGSELEMAFSHEWNADSRMDENNKSIKVPADATGLPIVPYQNPEFFMSYTPTSLNTAEDRGYGVHSGGNVNFADASRRAAMDLTGDESSSRAFEEPRSRLRWDKRQKKYVSRFNDEDGSKGGPLIRGESGVKLAASFRSGKFDAWKRAKRIRRLPRVGETENLSMLSASSQQFGRAVKHSKQKASKVPDKFRGDYERKRKKLHQAKRGGQELC